MVSKKQVSSPIKNNVLFLQYIIFLKVITFHFGGSSVKSPNFFCLSIYEFNNMNRF